ncbi:Spermidine Putrescine ABC transporter permease component potC [Candidatus Burkholderia verschuerenii]|uniref:Spermidine Putrescine ABC transporter permease component potC n=1 Tax=Candidatus Burkholderia verschuerenii TaxID=242163 RepID=A0A0L0MFT0_9BURK|nr:ABC transporter permease [Candidatus Burkholderia verschuerenii]KND61552.1 Spermidine Putrescine ABC transporter permease component potC [Candidatus Burkholderia verschuerenii]
MNQLSFGRVTLGVSVTLILAFLMIPVIIVVPLSFSDARFLTFPPPAYSLRCWYHAFFDNPAWIDAAKTTFAASSCAALIATPLGIMAAYGIQYCSHWSMRYLRTLLMLPIIIVAVGVFFVFTQAGYVNTLTGLIVADTMLGLPYVLISVGADLRTFDRTQEMVARSLGMNRFRAFMTVTLPQIKASVISAMVFVFIQALDETVVALFVSGGNNQTLTRRMFVTLRDEIDPTIAAISTMLTALTLCLVMFVVVSRRRSAIQA